MLWPVPESLAAALTEGMQLVDRRQRPAAPAPADPEPQLAALVERHRSGDPAALNSLMTALYPSIYRIVYRLAGPRDREQHEDLVQSSLEQVCRSIDAFEGRSRVSTFVFGICHRVVARSRRYDRVRSWFRRDAEEATLPQGSAAPDDLIDRGRAVATARAALDALDGILDTPGIDAIFVGPGDFSIAWTNGKAMNPTLEDMMDSVAILRHRNLRIPLDDVKPDQLRDSFEESRGNHVHEAIDIIAPRNTPIHAVEDGTIAKLWTSVAGGLTIYQFDPDKQYEYYYAHLEKYAAGLKDGDSVKRGQIIGYVGTSGNAPKNTPHLHFTIFELTEQKHWWEGRAINPYWVFTNQFKG